MSNYIGDFLAGSTIRVKFNTLNQSLIPTTPSVSPTFAVYKNSTTESTTGITVSVDYDGKAGLHEVAIDTSLDLAFYVSGEDYSIVFTAGTVDSKDLTRAVLRTFSISNRSRAVNVTQIAGQTANAAAAVTFPASIASPTNITQASGVTLTPTTGLGNQTANITGNLSGSVGSVAGNVTGSVGSVAGNVVGSVGSVAGNVVGSVGSVSAGVTVTTNNDKADYSLSSAGILAIWSALTSALTTVGSIGKFIVDRLPALVSGRVPAIVQAYDTGMAPLQPATAGRTLRVSATGAVEEVAFVSVVDELGVNALNANGLTGDIAFEVYNTQWNQAWPAGSWGSRLLVSDDNNRVVHITGSKHIASDVHELQPAVINNTHFAAGAIDANALAADAATEIATAVGNLQVLQRLDSMIESNGAGQFRFDTVALSLAPSGGGGGGTDWTANEKTAIRTILGFDASGNVSTVAAGSLYTVLIQTQNLFKYGDQQVWTSPANQINVTITEA